MFISGHNINRIVAKRPHVESGVVGEIAGLCVGIVRGHLGLPIVGPGAVLRADQSANGEPSIGVSWVASSFSHWQFSHFISLPAFCDSLRSEARDGYKSGQRLHCARDMETLYPHEN